ncbi:MAG: branched-chain-amino-acid transaminase [Planctomycetia bacterium]|nr:branched-chain-amino-acid transaminase [Planctomycetia bacterium]
MSRKVFLNGDLVDSADAKISVFDHGLLYGDGVFEGIRSYEGRIFRLPEHVRRLFASAKGICLSIPMTQEQMSGAIEKTFAANDLRDAYIRACVTRGIGTLGLDPDLCGTPAVFIIVDTIALYPKELYDNGLEIIIAKTLRISPRALDPRIKSLNYLNNILAKIEAIDVGLLEAVMLNSDGYVAEATGDNVFIVRKGKVLTPPAGAGILMGITRNEVIEIAKSLGIETSEENLTPEDLYSADECFLTGTAAEVVPVIRIDGRTIGEGKPGKTTLQLLGEFHRRTRS